MKITLTGKQVDIGDRLRKHVEEAIENSVNKYFNAPISCTVAFSKEGEDFNAEVTVHPAKNIVLKGSGVAGDPYSAFDNANTHIATRLRRNKNKLNDHKGKLGLAELANAKPLCIWIWSTKPPSCSETAPTTTSAWFIAAKTAISAGLNRKLKTSFNYKRQ